MAEDARERFIRESYGRRQPGKPLERQGITGTRQFEDNLRGNYLYNKFQTRVNEPNYFGMEQSVMDAMQNKYNQFPWSIYATPIPFTPASPPGGVNAWDVYPYNLEDLPPRYNINRGGLMSLV